VPGSLQAKKPTVLIPQASSCLNRIQCVLMLRSIPHQELRLPLRPVGSCEEGGLTDAGIEASSKRAEPQGRDLTFHRFSVENLHLILSGFFW
jgi:hypothetical protein